MMFLNFRRKDLWMNKILCSRSASRPSSTVNYFGRLPPEVLMKILSFLDASSLYSIGYVNKQLHELANSNALWYRLYVRDCVERKLRAKLMDEMAGVHMSSAAIQEKPRGHWKRLLFRKMAGFNKDKWLHQLKVINPYTGLPRQTEHVLRSAGVTWEMTVMDSCGRQYSFRPSRVFFSESSLSLTWQNLAQVSSWYSQSLQVHSVVPMPFDRAVASCSPAWRSLITEVDMNKESWHYFGASRLIRMKQSHQFHGITIGVWRGLKAKECSIVFVKMTLHFHKLVERSLFGSVTCPYAVPEHQPVFDDIDPEYGLHGYKVHVELHDMVKPIMSGRFTGLFCRRDNIRDGCITLKAISRNRKSEHTAFRDELGLKWCSEGMEGTVEVMVCGRECGGGNNQGRH
ncbi:hypothetical protein ACEWY4_018551 [Coilia grayii]|uniref:F-box domain-containing protein n=1 Tax=Coilia grayii TaxID=363190 RepID=A0ABD1JES4_9TELE